MLSHPPARGGHAAQVIGMRVFAATALAVLVAGAAPMPLAHADSVPSTASATDGSAGASFSSGMHHLGEGAAKIGEGIKQSAVDAWHAVKTGASAAAAKLGGGDSPAKPKPDAGGAAAAAH
jgi:ABC-type sugar transport system substrate-binding protein